jgi:hypothetical protein
MSAASSITNALLKYGRPMVLRRNAWANGVATPTDVTIYGVTEGYAPQELVNGITQGDSLVKFSNAQIAAASWPGPPQKQDQLIADGRTRTILAVDPQYLGTEVLAWFCQVRG